jgi:hypothetical protein
MIFIKKLRFVLLVVLFLIGMSACSSVAEQAVYDLIEYSVATIEAAETETGAQPDTLPSTPTISVPNRTPSQDVATGMASERPTSEAPAPRIAPEMPDNIHNTGELAPSMPILTETHQGFTYRPGQLVTVLAEGFKPGETLAVTLLHEAQGKIGTFEAPPVSPHGNTPIYLPVEIDAAGIYPDGEYTFLVSGQDGVQEAYTFRLDFLHPAEPASFDGCGVYPEPVLGSIVFVWCTGYASSDIPLTIRGVVNSEELFTDVVDTIYSDGVALYVLDIFADDPAGEWTLEMGQDVLTMTVTGGSDE